MPTHRPPTTPGEILSEVYLKPLNMSITDFAQHVCMTRTAISEIVHGKRGITALTAIRFAKALHSTPGFWLNAQLMCDVYEAQQSPEAKAADRIQPIQARAA